MTTIASVEYEPHTRIALALLRIMDAGDPNILGDAHVVKMFARWLFNLRYPVATFDTIGTVEIVIFLG